MNRLSYRVVFNAKRGQLVAVAESATSQGKSCGERAGRKSTACLRRTMHAALRGGSLSVLALATFLATQPAAIAQIIADPTAPANQRPTVLPGVTINIQTPSAAGVSRNTYSRFDMGASDTVTLNNNRTSNPWLATGSARVILNEVRSSNPSNLAGQLIVNGAAPSGARADVVFANPSGINVNGLSVFGAGRFTLTTGAPVITAGSLTGFNVTTGNVQVASGGFAVNGAGSYAEILSRSAVIGGIVRADQALNVITGTQNVDYATGSTTPLAGTGTRPTLAIDTKAWGGMYAGSITMLSTEAGVGVRNDGTLQANTGTGQLIVTADGRLQNTGRMDAAYTSVATVAADIDNSGNLLGRKLLMASAGANFNQVGSGMAQNEAATSPLSDPWHTAYNIGAGMAQDSGSASQVFINAKQDVNVATGARIASNASGTSAGGTPTKGQVVVSAGRNVNLSTGSNLSANGAVQLSSDGVVNATANTVSSATGDATMLAKQGITLSNSTVTGNKVHLETGAAFAETASSVSISRGQINGTQHTAVIASGDVLVDSPDTASVRSAGNVFLQAGKNLTFTGGTNSTAGNHFTAVAGEALQLRGVSGATAQTSKKVSITSGGDTTLSGGSIWLHGSSVKAAGGIDIEATKSNTLLYALPSQNSSSHTAVSLEAGKDLNISAYSEGVFAQGLNASGENVTVLSNGVTQINRVEQSSAGLEPLQSNINARANLTVGSIHRNAAVELIGSNLNAGLGHTRVMGSGNVVLRTSGTYNRVNEYGEEETIYVSPRITGRNVTVQGGAVFTEGANILAFTGDVNLVSLNDGITLNSAVEGNSTSINAAGNIGIHAKTNLTSWYTTYIANKNLALTAATGSVSNTGNTLLANDMLSVSSKGAQTHNGGLYQGGAVSFFNETGNQSFTGGSLNASVNPSTGSQSIRGNLSIDSGGGVSIHTTHLRSGADLSVVARSGALAVTAVPATPGGERVSLTSGRDLNLIGAAVQLNAPALSAVRDVNIASHAGNVLIDGVKSTFTSYRPPERLGDLRHDRPDYVNRVAVETTRLNANPQYASLAATYQATLQRPNSSFGSALSGATRKQQELTRLLGLMAPYEVDLRAAQRTLQEYDALVGFLSSNLAGAEQLGASITGRDINITSAAGVAIYGANITATGTANLRSSGLLPTDTSAPTAELRRPVGMLLAGLSDFYELGAPSAPNHAFAVMSRPTVISGQAGVNIQAAGNAAASAADLASLVINDSAVKSSAGTVHLQSLGDMRLESGQEEFYSKSTNIYTKRSWYGKKKTTTVVSTNQSVVASPVVLEGRNIALKSGGSIDAFATSFLAPQGGIQITAANALNLHAVDQLNTSTVNATSRSSWIGIKYRESNTTSTRTVQEQLPSRLAATMVSTASGWNTLLQGTQIQSSLSAANISAGVGPNARADAQIILEGIRRTVTESRTKESNYVVWQRQLGSGSTVETMTLPSFTGPQRPVFNAPGGISVQIPAGELTSQILTLSQQPGMGYLTELSQRRDVNWQPVKLAYDQWSYKQEGLTPAGAALLGVAVAMATGGMGAELLGTTGTFTSAAANAAFTSLAAQASITLVNNKGNIGKTLSDLAKSDIVKATLAAALTAGALGQLNALPSMQGLNLGDPFATKLAHNLINASGRALVNTAVNGGSLEDALKQALVGGLVDTAQGQVASQIKAAGFDYLSHKLAHALAGCVAGAAAGGACRDGAIGAAVGEVVAEMFDGQKPAAGATREQLIAFDQKVLATSKIVAGAVAAYAGGNAQSAITTAEVAVQNNYLSRPQLTALQNELNACKQNNCTEAQTNAVLDKYVRLSAINDDALAACTTTACVDQHRRTIADASALSLDVKRQVGDLLASERLIAELQGREKLSQGGTVQQMYARAERIEKARRELDQYVQAQCLGLSSTACTTKLQSSQATAGVVTEIFAGFTPLGFAVDIRDLLQATTMQDRSLAVLGIVLPGLGDGVKALMRGARPIDGALADVWRLQPTDRGNVIESHLAATEYKDWFNVGQLNRGKFPLVDFQKDNVLVSLKTVDTNGSSWTRDMRDHIDDLSSGRATVNDKPPVMVLDLRVQSGGAATAQWLAAYGRAKGVAVRISEFK